MEDVENEVKQMKCPKCGDEMDIISNDTISFVEEDEIEVETIYHCDNCEKTFLYSESFKRNGSEFCGEVED